MWVNCNKCLIKFTDNCKIVVSESGMAALEPDSWCAENVISPYTRLYYIIEGDGGYLRDDHGETKMREGHIYMIPPMHLFDYGCTSDIKKVFFHINIIRTDGFDVFREFGGIGELESAELVEKVSEDYFKTDFASVFNIYSSIFETLSRMARKYDYDTSDVGEKYTPMMKDMLAYISDNISAELSRQQIADNLGVSTNTVSNYFKNEMKTTVGKYIDELVFARAQRELIYTEKTIGEISDELGFCDQFYFSRRFRQFFYSNPIDFRKKVKNEYYSKKYSKNS